MMYGGILKVNVLMIIANGNDVVSALCFAVFFVFVAPRLYVTNHRYFSV